MTVSLSGIYETQEVSAFSLVTESPICTTIMYHFCMTRIGYARTSTVGQNLDLQVDALKASGVEDQHLYREQASGANDARPVLAEALAALAPGDVLVVWRLDRLGRSMSHLLATVADLGQRGIGFESLHDHVDTTSAGGRLVFHVLASLSEFERDLTRERIHAGLDAARARGQKLGRKTVMTPSKARLVGELVDRGESVAETARAVGVSRATLYRHLNQSGEAQ